MPPPLDEQSRVVLLVTGRLDEARIPYMISGSVALSVYVQPRMTRDIDIVVDAPESPGTLQKVFDERFYLDPLAVERAINERRMFNAIHLESLFKIDIVVRRDSPYRVEEFRRRRSISFEGTTVWVVAPEDLLLSKLEWWASSGSALQWSDLKSLAATPLDWGYVERWADELGLRSSLTRLRYE